KQCCLHICELRQLKHSSTQAPRVRPLFRLMYLSCSENCLVVSHPRRAAAAGVFCHAKKEDPVMEKNYFSPRDAGFEPWYDKEKLVVGDHRKDEIARAIENNRFLCHLFVQSLGKEDRLYSERNTDGCATVQQPLARVLPRVSPSGSR